jgi:ribonuclease VapC
VSSPQPKSVLDASAVLAYVLDERGATVVERLLEISLITAANLTEVLYRACEMGYTGTPDELQDELLATGLRVEPVIAEDSARAAELIIGSRVRATHGSLSLADGLCIAVAERLGLTVVGGDQLWETLDLRVEHHRFR